MYRMLGPGSHTRKGTVESCVHRLRVALNETELAAVNPGVIMTPGLYDTLTRWVSKHYRDALRESDLADPQLLLECRTALDELTQILKLGAVYPFQIN